MVAELLERRLDLAHGLPDPGVPLLACQLALLPRVAADRPRLPRDAAV